MKTPRAFLLFLQLVFVILAAGVFSRAAAQPSDAQIKKDLTGPKTVSIELGKPGEVEWSKTYKKFVWTRNFTAKVKTDDPNVNVLVKGYASYDVIGGKYVFSRSFVTSNSYDGIPDPTAADVQALIAKFGTEKFMGNYDYNHVVGKVESLALAPEPKYMWHTPNSVSFNVVAVFTRRTNDVGGRERIAQTYEIRLNRDAVSAPWKNLISTPRSVEKL
jgi:hypothetical protein